MANAGVETEKQFYVKARITYEFGEDLGEQRGEKDRFRVLNVGDLPLEYYDMPYPVAVKLQDTLLIRPVEAICEGLRGLGLQAIEAPELGPKNAKK